MIDTKKENILLFDLGNILISLNDVTAIWTGTDRPADGTPDETDSRWSCSQAVSDYETGRIKSVHAFYDAVRREGDLAVSEDEFYRILNNAIGDVFPGTHAMLDRLKQSCRLFLLSNTSESHWAICSGEQGLDRYFEKVFLSFEMGVMKPDPAAFEEAIRGINVRPENIWYYDDRQENVREALKQGINAHASFGGNTLINDLTKHGFLSEGDFSEQTAPGERWDQQKGPLDDR